MVKNPSFHYGHWQRIRNKVLTTKVENLEPVDVLELLLQNIFRRADTNEIARAMLITFGNLNNILTATAKQLQQVKGIGKDSSEKLVALFKVITVFNQTQKEHSLQVEPRDVKKTIVYLNSLFINKSKEVAFLLVLDSNRKITKSIKLSDGEDNFVHIKQDDVLLQAETFKARYVVLAHNHPQGPLTPSLDDLLLTAKIYTILHINDIELLDHIIISPQGVFSFANSGIMGEIKQKIKKKNIEITN